MAYGLIMSIWNFIRDKYSAGIPVMLLYVLESKGSSPGRQGFKMAVGADGDIYGTIGGGIMEHKFVERARSSLRQNINEHGVYRQVHDKSAGTNQSGMICSGEQTIFIYQVQEADMAGIHAIIHSIKDHMNGVLELSNAGIRFSDDSSIPDFHFEKKDDDFILKEKLGFKNTLHIVGGGHCSLALSRLMGEMDFYIHVYDERKDLNTIAQNTYAHKKDIVDSYAEIGPLIEEGENVYVVIMTFGYRTDDTAVRALLHKDFKYFGILGSKKKMEKMFDQYRKENIGEALLSNIHAPIGMQINSQTTAEIAVSIAAEIISVKNEK